MNLDVNVLNWMEEKGTPIKVKGKQIVDYGIWYSDPEYFKTKTCSIEN